jgi:uracil permease
LTPTFVIIASKGDFSRALGGFVLCGIIFIVVALIIGVVGTKWIDIVLPPAAMGPIVALIGLELSLTAANNAGLVTNPGVALDSKSIIVSLFTLAVVIFGSLMFRGFFSIIPILTAIVLGYGLAAILGVVDTAPVTSANWLAIPHFTLPTFDLSSMLIVAPAALVVISEHIGHLIVTSKIVDRDLLKEPGLHRSLLGDGISTTLSGFMGSVPTTTYGENMGVMAITRVYSVWVIGGAAVISIVLAFFGKLAGVINSIPTSVMGGISLFLFGVIAASGIRILVEARVDYSKARNLILTAVVFVVGVAGANDPSMGLPSLYIKIKDVPLKGMALATIVGIVLSLIFYVLDKLKLTNDRV